MTKPKKKTRPPQISRVCNCGKAAGIRSDHEAECAGYYLRSNRKNTRGCSQIAADSSLGPRRSVAKFTTEQIVQILGAERLDPDATDKVVLIERAAIVQKYQEMKITPAWYEARGPHEESDGSVPLIRLKPSPEDAALWARAWWIEQHKQDIFEAEPGRRTQDESS